MNIDVEDLLSIYDARIAALTRELVLALASNKKMRERLEALGEFNDGGENGE